MLFTWAAFANWATAHNNPIVYLEYGKYALNIYKEIIYGGFAKQITGYVYFIAAGQLIIALEFLAGGIIVKLSSIGIIIFFMAITPLGTGAAFSFSIILSTALCILFKNNLQKTFLKINAGYNI